MKIYYTAYESGKVERKKMHMDKHTEDIILNFVSVRCVD